MDEDPLPADLIPPVRDLVHELVIGNYAGLEADGRAGRLGASDIQRVIAEYPATLVEPPGDAYASEANAGGLLVDPHGQDPYWDVDVRLWTAEEGRSYLTVRLLARERDGQWRIEMHDLLVP
jgi:hypothetical protein